MSRSPLFDIYDPYGTLSEQLQFGSLPTDGDGFEPIGLVPVKRQPTISDLMPEEEKKGWLNTLAEMGSSGLATAGWLLDTPGSLVRGILAGKPLSFLGSSDERVTGRELLRQYGLAEGRDTWQNFGTGLAAEVLLDPLTYGTLGLSALGKGALSPAGKAVKAAGLLRDDALDSVTRLNPLRQRAGLPAYADDIPTPRVREYRRRLTPQDALDAITDPAARAEAAQTLQQQMDRFGATDMNAAVGVLDDFRIPGTNIGFSFGGGVLGDAVAQGFDRLGDFTKRAPVIGSVTRTAAALFDPAVGDLSTLRGDLDLTNELQLEKRFASAAARNRAEDVRRAYAALQYDARNAQVPESIPSGPLAGTAIPDTLRSFDSQQVWNALQDYVESRPVLGPTPSGAPLGQSSGNAVADWVLENVPEFRAVRDRFAGMGPEARQAAEEAGLAAPDKQSRGVGGFFPRQLRFFQDASPPDIPGRRPYQQKGWGRDERAFSVQDNFGRQRDPAYDLPGGVSAFRYLTGGIDPSVVDSRGLQQALINAPDEATRTSLIQGALDALGQHDPQRFTIDGGTRPYESVLDNVRNSEAFQTGTPAVQRDLLAQAQREVDARYRRLTNLVMNADTQFADQGIGIFDTPSWNNAIRYEMGQATNLANADRLTEMLLRRAEAVPAGNVQAGVNISLEEAAQRLGYERRNFRQMWQGRTGQDATNFSINESVVDAMRTLAPQSRLAPAEGALLGGLDSFTNAFKVGALASPAFHVRNAYSGAYNAATQGAFNPRDYWAAFRASQGNYGPLQRRVAGAPRYANRSPEEALRQFMIDAGANRISSGNVLEDISGVDSPASVQGLYPGASNEPTIAGAAREMLTGRDNRTWRDFANDFFSLRGVGLLRAARKQNTNPLLVLNDAVGQGTEDMLRTGTFLNQVRKGVDPRIAGDITRLSQLDYTPQAFTSFERSVMKRLFPFYSFQRQIIPSIADNILYRPGQLQGQTIRTVTRGTEPSEENFVPEYLRQSAAIPLPENWPSILGGQPADGLRRYVTNIDLPFESTLNLFTPGIGATKAAAMADSVQKTGSNILGQTNPLLKAPLEYITNRQLYTGRDLSDLYSVLEQDLGPIGRPLEQALINLVPFGARGVSMYRQLTDDRLDPVDAKMKAAFNVLAGVKLTDVDEERTKRMAARDMLNKILETTPGVRTYENITVPPEVLQAMPQEQQRMYLLYKVVQAEAAKRARDKKKQEMALDPLQLLGAVNQF